MMLRTSVFWEAILWGAAISMMAFYLSISVIFKKSFPLLICFGVICGVGLFTRPNITMMIISLFTSTLLILFLRSQCAVASRYMQSINSCYKKSELAWVIFLFSIFILLLGCLNHARWGSSLQFAPFEHNVQCTGARLTKYLKYGPARIDRVPQAISYYFIPTADNFKSGFPFVKLGSHVYFQQTLDTFDYVEPSFPISLASPIFTLLGFCGMVIIIYSLFKGKNRNTLLYLCPVICSAWISTILLLPLDTEAMRYKGDIMPAIIFFSVYTIISFLRKIYDKSNHSFRNSIWLVLQDFRCQLLIVILLTFISLYFSGTARKIEHRYWFP